MDGIILAGGWGKRMRPLTLVRPKPLLSIQNYPILAWSLASLRGIVERVLVVVHYLKEQIADFMKGQTLFADYQLVEQLPEPLGTGHALQCCKERLGSDEFLVINGDDLYSQAALSQLGRADCGLLAIGRADYEHYGVIVKREGGGLGHIDEKPPRGRYAVPAPCSIGAYKFSAVVFDYAVERSKRGEYEISDYATAVARDHAVKVVDSPFWLSIGDHAALQAAQAVDIERWISRPPAGCAWPRGLA